MGKKELQTRSRRMDRVDWDYLVMGRFIWGSGFLMRWRHCRMLSKEWIVGWRRKIKHCCSYPSATRMLTRLPMSPSARRPFASAALTFFCFPTGTAPPNNKLKKYSGQILVPYAHNQEDKHKELLRILQIEKIQGKEKIVWTENFKKWFTKAKGKLLSDDDNEKSAKRLVVTTWSSPACSQIKKIYEKEKDLIFSNREHQEMIHEGNWEAFIAWKPPEISKKICVAAMNLFRKNASWSRKR